MAINPTNPNNLVIAAGNPADGGRTILVSSSKNLGASWTGLLVGDVNDGKGADTSRCDPTLAFDGFGNLFLAYVVPCTGTMSNLVLLRSTTGGAAFPNDPNQSPIIAGPAELHHASLATGPNATQLNENTVWVSYSQGASATRHVFVRGAATSGLGAVGSFHTAVQVSDLDGADNADLAIGPAGQVLVVWARGTQTASIHSDRDADGLGAAQSFGTDSTAVTSNFANDTIPAQPDHAISATPILDIHRGTERAYLVYTDEPSDGSDDTDIRLLLSTDYGITWSAAGTVSDDNARSQFLPSLSVDQTTGHVAVAWYDARLDDGTPGLGSSNSVANDEVFVYSAVSEDAGASFRPNVRVSEGRSNQSTTNPGRDVANNFNEYLGVVSLGRTVFVAWADNSNSTNDNPDGAVAGLDIYSWRLVRANITRSAGSQSETAIAINPTNPSNLVIASNNPGDQAHTIVTAYSMDAGATWTSALVGHGNDGKGASEARCDPGLAFDRFGRVHLVYLAPCSSTGNLVLLTSSDNGQTFPSSSLQVLAGPAEVDRPDVATGPNGVDQTQDSVWVTYVQRSGSDLHVFVRGAAITFGGVGTFESARQVSDVAVSGIPNVAVGPDGQVVVAWVQSAFAGNRPVNVIYSDRDTDGLGPLPFGADTAVAPSNVLADTIPAQPDRPIEATPVIDIDRRSGRLYLVYTDEPTDGSDDTDIRLTTSANYDLTWSTSVTVTDTNTRSQFFPYLSVDQTTGNVAVAWYDARLDDGVNGLGDSNMTANDEVFVFGTVSTNGGTSFLPNVRVSRGRSNQSVSNTSRESKNNFGDYMGVAYFGGSFFASWADNSNSSSDNPDGTAAGLDIYVGRVTLLSVGGQVITATGTSSNDQYDVRTDSSGTFVQYYEANPSMAGVPTFTASTAAVLRTDVAADAGDDRVFSADTVPVPFTVTGGAGNDTVRGGSGADTIDGGDGNDSLKGGAGSDSLRGGAGNDELLGQGDNDTLRGDSGDDRLKGQSANDLLLGGVGNDILRGSKGNDDLRGQQGADRLFGGDQDDSLSGGSEEDRLVGGEGKDQFQGGAGDDELEALDMLLETLGETLDCGAGLLDKVLNRDLIDMILPNCEMVP